MRGPVGSVGKRGKKAHRKKQTRTCMTFRSHFCCNWVHLVMSQNGSKSLPAVAPEAQVRPKNFFPFN